MMQYLDLIIPYSLFVFATSGTPGPNNIMLAASGANFGVRATLPHIFGIRFGLAIMLLFGGFGLGEVFETYPIIHQIMRYVGMAFMVYLAYKIAFTKRTTSENASKSKPLSFLYGAFFQLINPKSWAALIGAIVAFIPADGDKASIIAVMFVVHFCIGFSTTFAWAVFGREIGRFLKTDRAFKIFNYSMAVLLILTIFTLFV